MSSNFLKVKCTDCSNEMVTFSHPASTATCQVCGATIMESAAGKGKLQAELLEVLE